MKNFPGNLFERGLVGAHSCDPCEESIEGDGGFEAQDAVTVRAWGAAVLRPSHGTGFAIGAGKALTYRAE